MYASSAEKVKNDDQKNKTNKTNETKKAGDVLSAAGIHNVNRMPADECVSLFVWPFLRLVFVLTFLLFFECVVFVLALLVFFCFPPTFSLFFFTIRQRASTLITHTKYSQQEEEEEDEKPRELYSCCKIMRYDLFLV